MTQTRAQKTIVYVLLIIFAALWLFPVVWIFLSSFKNNSELYQFPPTIWPKHFTFEHFVNAFEKGNFGRYFLNSAIVAVSSTLLLLLINSMAGFALAKYRF